MATMTINNSQTQLLEEISRLVPNYDALEVRRILKTAIAEILKCKVVDAQKNSIEDTAFSPKIQSLIGVVPDFSPKDLDKDERLKHILSH